METISWFMEKICIVRGICIFLKSIEVTNIISTTSMAIPRERRDTSEKIKKENMIESILLRFSYGAIREIFSFL